MLAAGRYVLLACLALLVSGCGGGGSKSTGAQAVSSVMVFHAASDAPKVNVNLDNSVAIHSLDFENVGQLSVTGTQSISVDALLPSGQTTQVVAPQSVDASASSRYDMFITGKVANNTLTAFFVADSSTNTSSTTAQVRFAHLAVSAPSLDVYVTAPGASVASISPTLNLSYKDVKDPMSFTAGTYEIQVTDSGQKTVVYDSGKIDLTAGSNLVIGAVDNTHYGSSPISLIEESQGSITELPDVNAGAGLRVMNDSYDSSPGIDFYLNTIGGTAFASSVLFPDVSPGANKSSHTFVTAGSTNVYVTDKGSTTQLTSYNFNLQAGHAYTVIAGNAHASIELFELDDNGRSIATEAQLRVVQGAGQGPNIDVYLSQGSSIGDTSPLVKNLKFGQSSGFDAVTAGTYNVFVTTAGTGTTLSGLGTLSVTLSKGGVYTLVVREDATFGSTGNFASTGLDDLAAP